MEADAHAVGAAVAAGGGVHVYIYDILLAIALTVADPNLDTEGTNLGVGHCQSVVDVGAEGVERRTALLEHLAAGHFGAAAAAVAAGVVIHNNKKKNL